MFKKNSPRRATPRHFKEPAREMPPRLTDGFPATENTLIAELEESLENLKEAVRRGEAVAAKAAAALAGDNDE